jgi:hypothetical protein
LLPSLLVPLPPLVPLLVVLPFKMLLLPKKRLKKRKNLTM